jgi:magnesium chelatase subunit H
MAMLKKLRGAKSHDSASGAKKMKMLKRLPKILRLIPGKAQDLRTWFLCMQYWLGGSDENIEQDAADADLAVFNAPATGTGLTIEPPREYPEVGLYHLICPPKGSRQILSICRTWTGPKVGILMPAVLYPCG